MKTKENSNSRKNLLNYLNKIKREYLEEKVKVIDLSFKYNVSEATMRRFLKENGINLGRRDLNSSETINYLREQIEKLLPNNTVTNICKQLGINHNKYSEIMGLESKSKQIVNDINDDFVDLLNPDFCYFLGIFLADGHIDSKGIYLSQSNAPFLHKIQSIMGHTGTLKKDSRSSNPNYKLVIVSKKLRKILEGYKIDSNKKFTAPYIDCGKYSRDFVRGVFDGDGCIHYTYTSGTFASICFSITSGSEDMINGLSSYFYSNNIPNTVLKKDNCYVLTINILSDILKAFHNLYDNCGNAKLSRKYLNFLKLEKLIKMNQEINDIVGTTLKDVENSI